MATHAKVMSKESCTILIGKTIPTLFLDKKQGLNFQCFKNLIYSY